MKRVYKEKKWLIIELQGIIKNLEDCWKWDELGEQLEKLEEIKNRWMETVKQGSRKNMKRNKKFVYP